MTRLQLPLLLFAYEGTAVSIRGPAFEAQKITVEQVTQLFSTVGLVVSVAVGRWCAMVDYVWNPSAAGAIALYHRSW